MSPQDFEEMDDGELVCFMGKKKRFRLKSMDWRRHAELRSRLGIKPPPLTPLPSHVDDKREQARERKSVPLLAWHFDPQLFRKWPQMTESRKEGEHLADREVEHQVSLGI
jgi:hypothetical protein